MEKQLKGAIFDLDGTIVDSMGMWRNLDRDFVTSQGLVYNPEITEQIVGMTLEEAAEYFHDALGLAKPVRQIIDDWNDFLLEQYTNKIPLKLNVDKLLEKWQAEGVKMCVATLTEKSMAECILKRFNLLDKFEFVRTVYDAGKSKLFPDLYLQCAELMGLKVEDCVVLEDTCHAIKTAKNAGFTVYAIDEDTAYEKEEIHRLCDKYITDYEELL